MSKLGNGKILPSAFFAHMEKTYGKNLGSHVIHAIQQFPEIHSVRVNSVHLGRYICKNGEPANKDIIDTWLLRRQYQYGVLSSLSSYRAQLQQSNHTGVEQKEDKNRLKMERKRLKLEKKLKKKSTEEEEEVVLPTGVPEEQEVKHLLEQIPWSINGRFLKHRLGYHQDPLSQAVGIMYSQDSASQQVLPLFCDTAEISSYEEFVKEIEKLRETPLKVLDLCSAPGGKASLLRQYQHPDSVVVCNDINLQRYQKMMQTINIQDGCSYILTNSNIHTLGSLLPHYFDIVMIDAPCSGSAMFRRSESALSAWNPTMRKEVIGIQKDQLQNVSKLTKLDTGKCLYMTCSFDIQENSMQIGELVTNHDNTEKNTIEGGKSLLDTVYSKSWNLLPMDINLEHTTITSYTAQPNEMKVEGGYYVKLHVNRSTTDTNATHIDQITNIPEQNIFIKTNTNNTSTNNRQLVSCPSYLNILLQPILKLCNYLDHAIYLQQNHNNDCVKIYAVPNKIVPLTLHLNQHVRSMPGHLLGYMYQPIEDVLNHVYSTPNITLTNCLHINTKHIDLVHLSRAHALALLHEREGVWQYPFLQYIATYVLYNQNRDNVVLKECLSEARTQLLTSGYTDIDLLHSNLQQVYNIDLTTCTLQPSNLSKYVLSPQTPLDEAIRRIQTDTPFPSAPVLRHVESPISAYTYVQANPEKQRIYTSLLDFTRTASGRPALALSDGVPFCWIVKDGTEVCSLLPTELQVRSIQDTPFLTNLDI